jgi:DNA polymerase-3 subunit beta
MKFIVSSTALLKELQLAGSVLNNSNTLPILDNFLFEIKDKSLSISASDIETILTTSLEIESKEEGAIAVPARLLLDTLKTFADQPLTFSVDEKTFAIEISSAEGRYSLNGQNPNDFPKTTDIEDAANVKLKGDILAEAFGKTLFATSSDELRPVMTGIFCQLDPNDITFVSTDAHKLVRYKRTDVSCSETAAFILPKKPVTILKNALAGSEEECTITFNKKNASFTFGKRKLTCLLIDGAYPNYEAVIPKENPNKLTIERGTFQNSIKRVSIFANKTTHQVRLKLAGSELAISAEDLDFSNKANERLTCNYAGDDMEIGFNSRFLSEMLSNIDSSNIVFSMSAPNRAGIITPEEPRQEGEDVLMLVMPVMLNN